MHLNPFNMPLQIPGSAFALAVKVPTALIKAGARVGNTTQIPTMLIT